MSRFKCYFCNSEMVFQRVFYYCEKCQFAPMSNTKRQSCHQITTNTNDLVDDEYLYLCSINKWIHISYNKQMTFISHDSGITICKVNEIIDPWNYSILELEKKIKTLITFS